MVVFLFLIALIYSSAGFGGGSMYLSLLSQVFPGASWIRFPALACNFSVSAIGSFNFQRAQLIPYRPIAYLLCVSVPLAMWSASFKIPAYWFLCILGIAIFLSGLAMLFETKNSLSDLTQVKNPWWMYPIVAAIGVLSGITGIGGGIYLAPILHRIQWASVKQIAATTSTFICINSLASLIALSRNGLRWEPEYFAWIVAVLLGGFVGSRCSIRLFRPKQVKVVTAIILMFVGIKLLFDWWNQGS